MSIASTVGSFFRNNGGRILRGGVGIAALGAVAYDSNYVGKIQADLYSSEKDAAAAAYYMNNALYNTDMSKISENVRNAALKTEMDWTWRRFFNEGIGYTKGFISSAIGHVIPLALGIGALMKNKTVSTVSTIALGVYGVVHFIKDFFGLGTPKNQLP